jgi:hypothetical protein
MARILHSAMKRLATGERGMTIVEVVVAGMILVVGSLGVLGMVDVATRNTFRAEQSQTISNVLQREMEGIKELSYDEVGLTTLPAHESGADNPNSRVEGNAFRTVREGSGQGKPMVSGGSIQSGPEPFELEDVKGTIYRYVVWDNCPGKETCVDGELLKRAIVAVKLDATAAGGAGRRYQEIQSQIFDPEAEPTQNPGPTPGGSAVTSWWLWLTDTTCDRTEPQTPLERLEVGAQFEQPLGDHPTHNTRGICAAGLKTGNAPGAPDLLWPEAPNLIEEEDEEKESESPVFDYATDVEPVVEPDRDKGLQIKLGGECGAMPASEVRSQPDASTTVFQQLHKWITPPIDTPNFGLTGDGTLNLWTQSIEHGVYPVTICVWVFKRENGVDTMFTHTFGSLPYATYSQSIWPNAGWTEVIVPLSFKAGATGGEIPLKEGSQVGLALSVKAGEKTSGIQTLYDEPTFDSRISLKTTGTLPEWP